MVALVFTSACGSEDPSTPLRSGQIALEPVPVALQSPVDAAAPPGDDRLFVVEQSGRIVIVRDDQLLPDPFLDIRGRVLSGGERGLLGLAFHPDYATNGRFFVHYTAADGSGRVSAFDRSADPDLADPASEQIYLEVAQPFANHNGGQLAFGLDGLLYIALGDGGSANDPLGSGQDRSTLLGSILRIGVDGPPPYTIPVDNPFVDSAGARPEIWAYGLRNPWRFSFDEADGTLYIADVGQNRWEEINAVPTGEGGHNFGWNVREASECFQAATCDTTGLTDPVVEYGRGDGCSVTGGYVYRGSTVSELAGRYVYSDYCDGWIRSFRLANGQAADPQELDIPSIGAVTSFGVDGQGELYVMTGDGALLRFASPPS